MMKRMALMLCGVLMLAGCVQPGNLGGEWPKGNICAAQALPGGQVAGERGDATVLEAAADYALPAPVVAEAPRRPPVRRLEVENIDQVAAGLPNGCEVTSLTVVLNYLGYDVGAMEMAENWLPCSGGARNVHPEDVYVGYPWLWSGGWYCYEGPVEAAAHAYGEVVGAVFEVERLSGGELETLKEVLWRGNPVVFWATLGYAPYGVYSQTSRWATPYGGYTPFVNVHCMVLTGYDDEAGGFYVADPLVGRQGNGEWVDYEVFWAAYEAMGMRALVVRQAEG